MVERATPLVVFADFTVLNELVGYCVVAAVPVMLCAVQLTTVLVLFRIIVVHWVTLINRALLKNFMSMSVFAKLIN